MVEALTHTPDAPTFAADAASPLDIGSHEVTIVRVTDLKYGADSGEPFVGVMGEDDNGDFAWTNISLQIHDRNGKKRLTDSRVGVMLRAKGINPRTGFSHTDFVGARIMASVKAGDEGFEHNRSMSGMYAVPPR